LGVCNASRTDVRSWPTTSDPADASRVPERSSGTDNAADPSAIPSNAADGERVRFALAVDTMPQCAIFEPDKVNSATGYPYGNTD